MKNIYWRNPRVAFLHDLLWVPIALVLAFWVRFNLGSIPEENWYGLIAMLLAAIPVQVVVFRKFGLYRGIWRFASLPDLKRIFKSVAIGSLLTIIVVFVLQRLEGVPRSAMVLYPLFLSLGLAVPRLLFRWFKEHNVDLLGTEKVRALVIGAGRAGELLVRDMLKGGAYIPVGFLDDDADKQGKEIHGVRVLGSIAGLEDHIRQLDVQLVMAAMPSAKPSVWREIVQKCSEHHVQFRTLPSLSELADGRVEVSRLRKLKIEDLLGRVPVPPNQDLLVRCVRGKSVMVTGAGGSIGSELCRQILRQNPACLVLFEKNEFALYQVEQELKRLDHNVEVVPLLGSVHHRKRVERVCQTFGIQTVYHAAAYKHVPLVESNPIEAIHNNIFGTLHTAQAALASGVETFVLISTDKAVRPTNVMGATKRFSEMILQALSSEADQVASSSLDKKGTQTCFCMVRFGNVIDSSGSVVPLFREQIRKGGPVTVTHPEITRFFMTIPEAAQLVIQAGGMCEGGDVFVLDMGEPVQISELAKRMIQLSGMSVRDEENPEGDIEIRFAGLRPGEKLYEELLIGDNVSGTQHPLILQADEDKLSWKELSRLLDGLEAASQTFDYESVRRLLQEAVPDYSPQCEIQDLIWLRGLAGRGGNKVRKLDTSKKRR